MGLFDLRCQATGVTVSISDVVLVILAKGDATYAPLAVPIRGHYDGYGSMDRIGFDATTARTLAGFNELHARKELVFPRTPQEPFGGEVSTLGLRALLEDIRQGGIFESCRGERPSTLVRAGGRGLAYAFVIREVFDTAVEMVRDRVSGETLAARLRESSFETLVSESLRGSPLARELVDDNADTRAALIDFALFNWWFDRASAWTPDHVGDQPSRADVRARLRDAKKRLAQWPQIVEALDTSA